MAPPKKKGYKGTSSVASRNVWNTGDLVLAKVKGHPWWPARVSDPDEFGYASDRRKVFVYFFGTKQIGSVQPAHVKAFTSETKKSLLSKPQVKNTISDFSRAVKEICAASTGFDRRTDDDLPTSSNDASDTAIEEVPTSGEVEHIEDNVNSSSVSRRNKRGNEMTVRGTTLGSFERETRSRTSLNNNLEIIESAEKGKVVAFYEPNKKRRKTLATSNEEPDRRSSAAKHAVPPRRFSSRHARLSESAMLESLADNTEIPDQIGVEAHLTVEAVCHLDGYTEGEMASFLDQPANCLADEDLIVNQVTHSSSPIKQLQESSLNSDGIGSKDVSVKGRCDAFRSSPVNLSAGVETVSEADGAPQVILKEKAEYIVPQTLLPKKKRKASRRLEKESESIDVAGTDEHCQHLHPQEMEGSPIFIPSEYQRRKRAATSHSQLHMSQTGGNDSVRDAFVVEEESKVNSAFPDTYVYLEDLPSPNVTIELRVPLEAACARESPQLDEKPPIVSSSDRALCQTDTLTCEEVTESASLETDSKVAVDIQDKEIHVSTQKQAFGFRLSTERDTSLPPKAEKYRIRSSIADGEAALPPSKRRQRALEAMSACAAEAAAVECSVKVEQQLDEACVVQPGHEDEHERVKLDDSQVLPQSSPQMDMDKLQPCNLNRDSVVVELGNSPAFNLEDGEKLTAMSLSSEEHPTSFETRKSSVNAGLSSKKDDATILIAKKGEIGKIKQLKVASHGRVLDGTKVSADSKSKVKSKVSDASHEKSGQDSNSKQQEHSSQYRGMGSSRMPSEMKAGFKDLIRANSASEKGRFEFMGALRSQEESNTNKVRAAVEAAKEVQRAKEALMKRQALFSKPEYANDFGGSPAPGGASLLNSPSHASLPAVSIDMAGRDFSNSVDFLGTTGPDTRTSPSSLSLKDATLCDTEAAVARDTFEGMLETLSRTKDSIARATRHALECSKFGIADQVVDIILRRLENEPIFHRRIDLFFLVDSITQLSVSTQGVAGAGYPVFVQAALPRLLQAAAPAGSVARENRRQCLKVLKLWSARKVMPESVLKSHVNELESHNDDIASGVSPRRPARFERAVDDPIREMEGMFVDEYGSNATFSLTGLLSSRMFEDDEEASGGTNHAEPKLQSSAFETEHLEDECPISPKKHRHILEDVEGELEMEDASPEGAMRSYGHPGGFQLLNIPLEPPPPPPPDSPPPSPPPLPKSPPPPSPPPPPPMSPPPPPPPSPPLKTYTSPFLHSYGSTSFTSIPASQLSPIVTHPGAAPGYNRCSEPQTVLSLAGAHPLHAISNDDASYENSLQQSISSQNIQQGSPGGAQMLNSELAYGSPSSFMMTRNSHSFNSGLNSSYSNSHVQVSHHGINYTQTKYSRLPSPPPLPPRLLRYGHSRAMHQSSPPPFDRHRSSIHARRGEYEHRQVNNDHGRSDYDHRHANHDHGRAGYDHRHANHDHGKGDYDHRHVYHDPGRGRFDDVCVPSQYTGGQVASHGDSSNSRKYSSHDSRNRPGYSRGPSHSSGMPSDGALAVPAHPGSAEMPNALYTGHAAGLSGADQAKVEALGRQRSSSSRWGPT